MFLVDISNLYSKSNFSSHTNISILFICRNGTRPMFDREVMTKTIYIFNNIRVITTSNLPTSHMQISKPIDVFNGWPFCTCSLAWRPNLHPFSLSNVKEVQPKCRMRVKLIGNNKHQSVDNLYKSSCIVYRVNCFNQSFIKWTKQRVEIINCYAGKRTTITTNVSVLIV